jgi:hypothetical protein
MHPWIAPAFALLVGFGAAPAQAGVALAVTTPDQNVRHREVAAGLVEALQARWDFIAPPLGPDEVATCAADIACLHRLARSRGADWLVTVGVAGLSTRGAIVTMQLVGPDGVVRIDDSAILPGSADPHGDGAGLAPRLLNTAGPPVARPVVERIDQVPARPSFPGLALVGGGTLVVGAGAGLGATLLTSPTTRDAALPVVIISGAIGVAGATVGVVLMAVE